MVLSPRVKRWAFEALLFVAVLWGVGAWQTRDLPRGPAPAFALRTLDGQTVSNESLRGKRALLVFWAPWCGVCRAASGNVSWLRRLAGERAEVVSIASQYQGVAQVRRYVQEQEVDYPVLLGGEQTARAYGVKAYPTLVYLDEAGVITNALVGYTTTLGMYLRL